MRGVQNRVESKELVFYDVAELNKEARRNYEVKYRRSPTRRELSRYIESGEDFRDVRAQTQKEPCLV